MFSLKYLLDIDINEFRYCKFDNKYYYQIQNLLKYIRKNYNRNKYEYFLKFYKEKIPLCLESGEISDNLIKGTSFGFIRLKKEYIQLQRKVNCMINTLNRLHKKGYISEYLTFEYWLANNYKLSEAYDMLFFLVNKGNYSNGSGKYYTRLFDEWYDETWTLEAKQIYIKSILSKNPKKIPVITSVEGWEMRGWGEESEKKQQLWIENKNYKDVWFGGHEGIMKGAKKSVFYDSKWQKQNYLKKKNKYTHNDFKCKSHFCIEYWMEKGYTKQNSKDIVSIINSNMRTKEAFIKRYGEIEGTKKYIALNKKWRETFESKENFKDIEKRRLENSNFNLDHLMHKYGELEGKTIFIKRFYGRDITSLKEFDEYFVLIGEQYDPLFYDKNYRLRILKEQNYICGNPTCGKTNKDAVFHLHHIDYVKKNTDRENLIFLCNSCHSSLSGKNRKFFIKQYKQIQKNILEKYYEKKI